MPSAPRKAEAEQFFRVMTAGRNGALHLGVRCEDDDSFAECVVKPSGGLDMPEEAHLREWVGAEIARSLGVTVPRSMEVLITPNFANSVGDQRVRTVLSRSMGTSYGSEFVAGGTPWVRNSAIPPDLLDQACLILAMDVFLHNYDRRVENPNVMLGQDRRLLAFDHGDAMPFHIPLIGAPDPVTDPLLGQLPAHVFSAQVRARITSLDAFRVGMGVLDDQFFEALEQLAPAAWAGNGANRRMDVVMRTLIRRRNALEQWLPQVETWLAR